MSSQMSTSAEASSAPAAAGRLAAAVAPSEPVRRDLHCLFTHRQLRAVLGRERARADRNNLEFSLVLFRVRADEPRLMLRLARMLLRRSRAIDEIGWFDETCLA